jgi:tRNA(Ile)-lysidine synthase
MNLLKKIQENIYRHELFERGARIVVGVSGGPDSVCLLNILHKLKNKYDLKLVIAHINYGLRGKDSDKDEQLVKKIAEKHKFAIEIKHNTQYTILNTNLEEKLRNFRYKFFEDVAKKHKATAIAVAHNMNDQAETVLARMIRGSGLRGLAAMKFKNGKIIRPFLNVRREEILAYLHSKRVPYRIDKSNLSLDFTRNKIRNKLIPVLEKGFNPRVQETLFKFSQSAAADYDFIQRFAEAWLKSQKMIRVSKLNELHGAICAEALRQLIEKLKPNLRDIESGHLNEIMKTLKSTKNKRQKITLKGLKIERRGDRLTINKI